jgi:hypothetical protein
MSASIRVETGISAGTMYWIDRPVLRIGSDPGCEICLPTADVAPHALTLEFRDGNYRAYNRSSEPIRIGAAVVQQGATAVWGGDQAVQLPGDLRLVLQVDGDPRPSPRVDSRRDDGFVLQDGGLLAPGGPEAAAEATAKKKSSSTMVQLAIIGACILGMAVFLSMRGGGGGTAQSNEQRVSFDQIVATALQADKDDAARALLPRLQFAQAALVRGHRELARLRFLKLRDQLIRQNESLSDKQRESLQPMKRYVEYRLGELN